MNRDLGWVMVLTNDAEEQHSKYKENGSMYPILYTKKMEVETQVHHFVVITTLGLGWKKTSSTK